MLLTLSMMTKIYCKWYSGRGRQGEVRGPKSSSCYSKGEKQFDIPVDLRDSEKERMK